MLLTLRPARLSRGKPLTAKAEESASWRRCGNTQILKSVAHVRVLVTPTIGLCLASDRIISIESKA
jgi:hypothetical protein